MNLYSNPILIYNRIVISKVIDRAEVTPVAIRLLLEAVSSQHQRREVESQL